MFLSLRLKGRGLQGVNFRVLCTGLFIKITEQEKLSLNDGLRLANPKPLMQGVRRSKCRGAWHVHQHGSCAQGADARP